MVNYDLSFSVSEISKILETDRKLIKTWAHIFRDYLSSSANPEKGLIRKFNLSDIRVLSYVVLYWESEPDLESIKIGLNENSQYEIEIIDNLIIQITPLFITPPENIEANWNGLIYNGLSEFGDTFFLANSYKLAGDRLLEIAIKNEETSDLFFPAIYNYRHATELYIKSIIGKYKQSHDLIYLLDKLKLYLRKKFDSEIPQWFENIILVFNDFDPNGTTFRYGGNSNKDEVFLDFTQVKTLMEWLSKSFENIKSKNI